MIAAIGFGILVLIGAVILIASSWRGRYSADDDDESMQFPGVMPFLIGAMIFALGCIGLLCLMAVDGAEAVYAIMTGTF